MEYIVIDGYNVINQWADLFDLKKEPLEDSRDRLLNMLSRLNVVKVVTSDFLEHIITMFSGGSRMSPRELRLEIQADLKVAREIGNTRPIKSNTIM